MSVSVELMAKHSNHSNHTNINIQYVTDNLEPDNRSNKHLKYKDPYPNNTLELEYDVKEQIYLTNITYKIEATFNHVYGHQDSKSNRRLTIEEKINWKYDIGHKFVINKYLLYDIEIKSSRSLLLFKLLENTVALF